MSRSEARLQFGIWREGLDGASTNARLLYVVLLTEPTMNHAGVGAMRLSKWSVNAALSADDTTAALAELATGQWVVVDRKTEEILVRTMIRNDGVADQPNVLKGAIREALQTESVKLRKVLADELRKLPPKRPDGVSKAGKPVLYPDPHAAADELDPPGPKPPGKPFPNPSGACAKTPEPKPFPNGSGTLLDVPGTLPEPSKSEPFPNPSRTPGGGGGGGGEVVTSVGGSVSRPAAQKRGTRIPEDFTPTPTMIKWAREKTPHVDGRRETEKFINHWTAKAGREAVKVDWPATWRNWMLTAEERSPGLRIVGGRPVSGDGVMRDPKTNVAVER